MRIIAGAAKGRQLFSVPGSNTRPITDRAKEALFSILGNNIVDARFLNLFAGTGAVGIEALSRGAAEVVFIERWGPAQKVLRRNLDIAGMATPVQIVHGDAFKYLASPDLQPFDFVFVAPPQYQGLWLKALRLIDGRPELLSPEAEVIVQIHPKEFEEAPLAALEHFDTRRYGSVQLDFYGLKQDT